MSAHPEMAREPHNRIPDAVVCKIRRLRYQQRWSVLAISRHLGVSQATVSTYAPRKGIIRKGRVRNAPLRWLQLDRELTASELCDLMGWSDPCPGTHVTRVRRILGVSPWAEGYWATTMSEEYARLICRALDVEFYDIYPELEPAPAAHCHCGEPMIWAADECGFCAAERMLACA